jgi:hypothetical protein
MSGRRSSSTRSSRSIPDRDPWGGPDVHRMSLTDIREVSTGAPRVARMMGAKMPFLVIGMRDARAAAIARSDSKCSFRSRRPSTLGLVTSGARPSLSTAVQRAQLRRPWPTDSRQRNRSETAVSNQVAATVRRSGQRWRCSSRRNWRTSLLRVVTCRRSCSASSALTPGFVTELFEAPEHDPSRMKIRMICNPSDSCPKVNRRVVEEGICGSVLGHSGGAA